MGKLVADITMSLDGFITGPDDAPGRGLGEHGEALHNWVMGGPWRYDADVRCHRGLGRQPSWRPGRPVLRADSLGTREWADRRSPFIFVTDGIDSALAQAQAVAGDKDVGIGGGANVIQQYLAAGLVDELRLHLAPVLLGTGKRLFDHLGNQTIELQQTRVVESPYATHLFYTVRH